MARRKICSYSLKIRVSQCHSHQFVCMHKKKIPVFRNACKCLCTNIHTPRSPSRSICFNSFSRPLTLSVIARPAVINYNAANMCVHAERGWAGELHHSIRHNEHIIMCWFVFERGHWIHFFPWLCCLCAEAPLFTWCGMGICLWAILIMSWNGKCLMCSGEVIDIDICCRGLWRGSIIAGSQQSQLYIIRQGCVFACVCAYLCVDIVSFLTVVQHGNVTRN